MGERELTLIIPTCGRPSDLAACLQSIEEAAGPELTQIIVIDDGPGMPASVPRWIAGAEVHLQRNPRSLGAAASRNKALGILHPDAGMVGFLDDDVRLTREWFSVALSRLAPEWGAITGPVRRFDAGLVSRARQIRYDARYESLRPYQEVDFLAGGNAVIWCSALKRAGQFPETATMSDTLLARRLGEQGTPCHFVPDLVVLHRNSKGARQACVAARQAGALEARHCPVSYARRLAAGIAGVRRSPDPPAAALNVALDAVFLTAHAMSRASWLAGAAYSAHPTSKDEQPALHLSAESGRARRAGLYI